MLPGDRLVCALVEPQVVGVQFKTWPLHVTVVPWFRLDTLSSTIANGLALALQTMTPVRVTTDGEAKFGPRGNRSVRLLQPVEPLEQIEIKVRAYLHKKRAFLIDETTKKPYSFRPHVTAQNGFLLPENAAFQIDTLYIVEQKGDYKEIVSEIRLHNRSIS
jgi:2'-5' RNA ligase